MSARKPDWEQIAGVGSPQACWLAKAPSSRHIDVHAYDGHVMIAHPYQTSDLDWIDVADLIERLNAAQAWAEAHR